MNSVVTTRNLLEACVRSSSLRRFVSVSSFSVYSNRNNPNGRLLDESSPIDTPAAVRNDAYAFAKVKQDEIVREYGSDKALPFVVVRPGTSDGEGNEKITGRVGVDTLGIFMHMGGSNRIPFTFIDNCADAIALAGLVPGIEGEVFNIVDDDLPTSRKFLWLYKRNVKRFPSIYVPHALSLALCSVWEKIYSDWSRASCRRRSTAAAGTPTGRRRATPMRRRSVASAGSLWSQPRKRSIFTSRAVGRSSVVRKAGRQ